MDEYFYNGYFPLSLYSWSESEGGISPLLQMVTTQMLHHSPPATLALAARASVGGWGFEVASSFGDATV